LLTSSTLFSNPDDKTDHADTEYDEKTGHILKAKQVGKISNTQSFTYNADGDFTRQDGYNQSGKLYVSVEFVDRLQTRRTYKSGDTVTKEIRCSYDEQRRPKESKVSFKGRYICRLTYDRLPDGTTKKTSAFGPNGDLWAEYLDQEVIDIERDGSPISGKPVKLYKTGNWW
jgi:hypothetical protein